MDRLVPGRTCGDCTLCCIVPSIDKPEMQKLSGVPCRHCASGCGIYETRPRICRDYYCGWRQLEIFDEEWRPDKSGVYAILETDGVPMQSGFSTGINLTLVGNPLKTVREHRFIDFVAHGIRNNIPLFIGLPGPKGKQAAKLLLNGREMHAAAAGRARGPVRAQLEKALKKLAAHDFQDHVMKNSGNDMSVA